MQIKIDTEILETIFTHATTAARLAGYLDDRATAAGGAHRVITAVSVRPFGADSCGAAPRPA